MDEIYTRLRRQLDAAGLKGTPCVWGTGPQDAPVMLVGEAPGKDEVRLGRPFVGKAGQNLDEFLQMTGVERKALFITNVVKFRPCKVSEKGTVSNRPPTGTEIALCAACLREEIGVVRPRCVVTLGNTALKALLGKEAFIGQLHGQPRQGEGFMLFPLYHPASIIYRRELKSVYEADLLRLRAWLDAQGIDARCGRFKVDSGR